MIQHLEDESFWSEWFQSGKGRLLLPPEDFTALLVATVLKPGLLIALKSTKYSISIYIETLLPYFQPL